MFTEGTKRVITSIFVLSSDWLALKTNAFSCIAFFFFFLIQVLYLFGCVACGILAPLTRDRTCAPVWGVRRLNHWTIREILAYMLLNVHTVGQCIKISKFQRLKQDVSGFLPLRGQSYNWIVSPLSFFS